VIKNGGGGDSSDEEMAVTEIQGNNNAMGRPNMTVTMSGSSDISALLPQVQLQHPQVPSKVSPTHRLHQLGFKPSSTKKGVCIDRHERSDIVTYRKIALHKLEELKYTHAPVYDIPSPES
jgi:hypothetical protein